MSSTMLLASNAPFPEVTYPADFIVHFDVDGKVVDDGGKDDGFAIVPTERVLELSSEKTYFAVLEWYYCYTPGRAERIIAYLEKHLEHTDEIEFWHIWQDMDFGHRVRKAEIPIHTLTAEDIRELDQLAVWQEPVTDYCYVIVK